ncbi:unnamed protein product [Didymodactylos carnosus]|uniref:Tetratricopeptide repeat protein n=1 Tax=Didymodactylos carnosus TaxID=1234261 RepID=A0A814TJI4_9BILA|nr:unnamed protein product [Didymodactylos carnosus]CAF3926511.1 unnamed protein product [Didymodactylos carnosus]
MNNTITTTAASSNAGYPKQRIVQNFVLIWDDANIDESKQHCQNTLAQLRRVVNAVNICTVSEQYIQHLRGISNEKAFIIASDALGQNLVPDIHPLAQVEAIYIFGRNKASHEQWAQNWSKIKGVYTEIKPICEALQLAAKQCNEDSTGISLISAGEGASSENLNQLEPTFMYTQIFKEILLEMEYNKQAITDMAKYCRGLYQNNMRELNIINEFERDYNPKTPIWWYTRECFTYQMLNRALRNLEGDTIINMGFFICDLHRQIEKLHKKQVSKVSLGFAESASKKGDMVGILFVMTIDPLVSSAPFAAIRDVSYFKTEEEILFSMHTVFCIGEIKQIETNNPLYQVELKLSADDDEQLRSLTKRIREEAAGPTGWRRLGRLLLKVGQLNKAEELYNVLLEQPSNEDDKAHYYNQLGLVKYDQRDYKRAIWYHEKAIEIKQKTLAPDDPLLAVSYSNIGVVYGEIGQYAKALSFYEKTLEIEQKTLSPDHPSLATSYTNIGGMYCNMGEYSKALPFFEKDLEISQKTLPPNHPDLATSYNNIGFVYENIKQYQKALLYLEHAQDILQRSLPPNHFKIINGRVGINNVKMQL